jgi:hypothetical protein
MFFNNVLEEVHCSRQSRVVHETTTAAAAATATAFALNVQRGAAVAHGHVASTSRALEHALESGITSV